MVGNSFPVGAWVRSSANGNYGYVEELGYYYVKVHFIFYKSGEKMKNPFSDMLNAKTLELMPLEPRIYSEGELDIALLTNDV